MYSFTELLFFFATLLALTMLRRALRKKADNRRYPPSLPSLPIVGSLPFIRKVETLHEFFMGKAEQLGPIFTFRAGSSLCLTLNDSATIKEALVNNNTCFAGRASYYVERITNKNRKGVASRDFSDEFKHYHKLSLSVLKEFGFGVNRLMEARIQQEFEAIAAFIRAKDGKEFNPGEVTSLATYNVMKNMLFGQRIEYENGHDELLTLFALFVRNATFVIDLAPSLLKLVPYFSRRLEICVKSMSRACEILKADIEKVKNCDVKCFVSSYLAKAGPDCDFEQLIYTTRDVILGGAESSASTLLWLLIYVANNPLSQERLQKDIGDVIPRHRFPSLDDQPKLPFVEATMLEIMRLRSSLPIAVPHLTLSDSEICGYFVPKGTKVFPNIHAAHMDPKQWKDPEVFRPERFLDETNNIIGRDRVISFSMGRRSCLGEVLARPELFLFLVGWIQRFHIQPGKDGQKIDDTPVVEATMKPRPFTLRMIPRAT